MAGDLYKLVEEMEREISRLHGQVVELKRMIGRLAIRKPRPYSCGKCGLEFVSVSKLDEHSYLTHDGPEPNHWREAERRTA